MSPSHPAAILEVNRREEDEMRRTFSIGVLLLAILGGVAIGVGAYHAGVNHGLAQAANARVVHVVEPGYGPGFGFFLFPLFFIGLFLVLRGAFWRRRWHHHDGGPWGRGPEGREGIDAMHRRLHE